MKIIGKEELFIILCFATLLFSFTAIQSYQRNLSKSEIPVTYKKCNTFSYELSGTIEEKGIYTYSSSVTIETILKDAGEFEMIALLSNDYLNRYLENGSSIRLQRESNGTLASKISKMDGEKLITLLIPIQINEATFEDLVSIPGIGSKTAEKIIEYRYTIGKFERLEQLKEIGGIGDKKLEEYSKYLKI